jgi:hypothetical protein
MATDKPEDAEYTEGKGSIANPMGDSSSAMEPTEPIPAEIKRLDPKTREVARAYFSFHSGPLPPAKFLEDYERVCPGDVAAGAAASARVPMARPA